MPGEATLRKALVCDLEKCGAGATSAEKSRLRSLRKMLAVGGEAIVSRKYAVREGGALARYTIRLASPVVSVDKILRGHPNPLPAGTKCLVVEKRESDGTMRCMITRPFEGWVNLTDLVPFEGDYEWPQPKPKPKPKPKPRRDIFMCDGLGCGFEGTYADAVAHEATCVYMPR